MNEPGKKDWPGTTNNLDTIIPLTVHRKSANNFKHFSAGICEKSAIKKPFLVRFLRVLSGDHYSALIFGFLMI